MVEFAPSGERKAWRSATNGMSVIVQQGSRGRYRTELFGGARASAAWIVRLLCALAVYPIEEETCLGEMQTVPLAGPVVAGGSEFTGILIAPPGPGEPGTLGAILGVTPEPILVHQVVAISGRELAFARHHGSEALWRRLLDLNRPLLLDEARPEAAGGPPEGE